MDFRRYFYLCSGFVALAFGIAGVLLPLVPGTPFLILAAFCFSKSSQKFHDWLVNHKYLGPPIRSWNQTGAIRPPIKWATTFAILLSAGFFLSRESVPTAGKIIYAVLLCIGLGFLWTRPSR